MVGQSRNNTEEAGNENQEKRLCTLGWRFEGRQGRNLDGKRRPEVASYGFNTRFEGVAGTNPEELIGAAHASCFTMALSMMLGEAGFTPESLETKAVVTLEKVGEGFGITAIELVLRGDVPGADKAKFSEIANKAKEGCPVSKALAAVPISLTIE